MKKYFFPMLVSLLMVQAHADVLITMYNVNTTIPLGQCRLTDTPQGLQMITRLSHLQGLSPQLQWRQYPDCGQQGLRTGTVLPIKALQPKALTVDGKGNVLATLVWPGMTINDVETHSLTLADSQGQITGCAVVLPN